MSPLAFAHLADAVADLVMSTSSDGTTTIVSFRGEADRSTLSIVSEGLDRVIAGHDRAVVVDLTQTTFLDISTVREIGLASEVLRRAGRSITLRSPSRQAVRMLALVGLSNLIEAAAAA